MEIIIFLVGVVVGGGAMYLVARNNQAKFNKALGINPKAKLNEVLMDIKGRLRK